MATLKKVNIDKPITVAAFSTLSTKESCVALLRLSKNKEVLGTSGFKGSSGFNPSGNWNKLAPKQTKLPEKHYLEDVKILKMLPKSTRFVWFPANIYK